MVFPAYAVSYTPHTRHKSRRMDYTGIKKPPDRGGWMPPRCIRSSRILHYRPLPGGVVKITPASKRMQAQTALKVCGFFGWWVLVVRFFG